jgi:PAS domain-containing protein
LNIPFLTKFILLVVVGLATVFLIDPLDPTTVSTPFCLGIVLMGLSLRQSLTLVVTTSVVYFVLTIYALVTFHQYITTHVHTSAHPLFWLFQRSGLFLVLCMLAIYLTHYRTETERILTRFRAILGKLPSPVIISDVAGNIVFANEAVSSIFNQAAAEVLGKSYFDFVLTEAMKGHSIRSYFELFEADTNGTLELETTPFGRKNKKSAQIICLGTGPNRIMITVIQNIDLKPDAALSQSSAALAAAALASGPQKL